MSRVRRNRRASVYHGDALTRNSERWLDALSRHGDAFARHWHDTPWLNPAPIKPSVLLRRNGHA